MESKVCGGCKKEKSVSEFNKKKDKWQSYCRPCDNARQKEHYVNNKPYYYAKSKCQRDKIAAYVNEFKLAGCSRCSESDIACLDLHHLGNKDGNVADLVTRGVSLERLKFEIDKCILLCANCHRKEHYYKTSGGTGSNPANIV